MQTKVTDLFLAAYISAKGGKLKELEKDNYSAKLRFFFVFENPVDEYVKSFWANDEVPVQKFVDYVVRIRRMVLSKKSDYNNTNTNI